jgi:hypothetical protein
VCPEATAVTQNNKIFPCYADIHESFITDRGSIIITMYNVTTADLTLVNGTKDDWVFDCLFFDVDIKTNKTLFRWSALEAGIPITDSKAPFNGSFGEGSHANPYDWFHINSVQSVRDGYFVNGRHVWTSYNLDSTGAIEWQIQDYLFFVAIADFQLTKSRVTPEESLHSQKMATSYITPFKHCILVSNPFLSSHGSTMHESKT